MLQVANGSRHHPSRGPEAQTLETGTYPHPLTLEENGGRPTKGVLPHQPPTRKANGSLVTTPKKSMMMYRLLLSLEVNGYHPRSRISKISLPQPTPKENGNLEPISTMTFLLLITLKGNGNLNVKWKKKILLQHIQKVEI